jgi:Origin of replication binding protein
LLALSTRHTYSSAVTTRLNLKSYCDIDTKDINLPDHQRVVCQIESLYRIINKCKCEKKCKCPPIPYDLWLDEVVSVNSQAHTRLAGRSREHLYKLIHEARHIIVMDNDLTDLNIDWIKSLRKGKQISVIHNTYQPQKGKLFHLAPNKETLFTELWDWAREMSVLKPEERKSASVICHLRYDLKGIVSALRDDFPELRIKEYHGESDPVEKAQDFSNVEEAWKDVDIVAYTSTLKIGVSCTNPKFERAFCLFKSNIETNAGTNQMLFRMRCIKEYTCHIEQRASNLPITEQGLLNWLLKAKRECLPQELQNRGIFPDAESIIRNKDIPTVRLWVAYMLEKFRSRRLFGWRMVDFLKKAGMLIDILESVRLPETEKEALASLKNKVDVHSIVCKAEGEREIANANIINHETAEILENKPKKTLEEMRALKRFRIAECYGVLSESLTEDFITYYGEHNEMKWFRNLRKLRDAGSNNETAVEAITREDYRNDRLTTVTQSEKHRICLDLLKTCTPVKDIDDRNRYKVNDVKTCLNSPESIQYLQNLVPKMARVFDNTDASRSAKKSGLKSDKSKLGLLNSALSAIYGIKFKTTNNKNTHYRLVGAFDNEDAPKLPPYQTGEGQFYENGEDMRYGYSKLSPDELEITPSSVMQLRQELFDIC